MPNEMHIRWWFAWGLYGIGRLGDLLTTAYQLHCAGDDAAVEASPLPHLFMRAFGASAGNLIHEGVAFAGVVAACLLFRPIQRRYRGWLEWMARRRVPLVHRIPREALSAIDQLSPAVVPMAVGLASMAVMAHNVLVIWLG